MFFKMHIRDRPQWYNETMPHVVRLKPTWKERRFAEEYVKNGGVGTTAALQVYDTDNYKTASSISSENLEKPRVIETIEQIAANQGITADKILSNFNKIAVVEPEKVTAEAIIKANIEMAKILRLYPDKKTTHVRLDVKSKLKEMNFTEAKNAYQAMHQDNKEFLSEASDEPDVVQ